MIFLSIWIEGSFGINCGNGMNWQHLREGYGNNMGYIYYLFDIDIVGEMVIVRVIFITPFALYL